MTDQPELRDKDRIILKAVSNGHDDVQKITAETTLQNHHVTYAFQKLEQHNLLKISKPDGYTERIIDGQKRVFQHPKQAELTDKGRQHLNQESREDLDHYENLSKKELVEKAHSLEQRVDSLERKLETLKRQIQSGNNY
jgi:predicted transcriptional regulator